MQIFYVWLFFFSLRLKKEIERIHRTWEKKFAILQQRYNFYNISTGAWFLQYYTKAFFFFTILQQIYDLTISQQMFDIYNLLQQRYA